MAKVVIKNVVKAFGDNVVIKDFTQEFSDGQFITLLGPSGCGKTTMLRMIAGFEKPTSGSISIGSKLVNDDKVFIPPEKRNIGMVFQSYAVWPHMTVYENVAYPLTIQKKSKEEIKQAVDKVLGIVHLRQYAARIPSMLSGGQQQRVALARALVASPKLLLLDEPLSNLDAKLRESMRFEIKEIQQKMGITVVYVTHDQTEAMAMSDKIILLNKGIIQQIGAPSEIYNQPVNQFVCDFLGKVNFVKATAADGWLHLKNSGQKLAYKGDKTGDVEIAIRPENIGIVKENGKLSGVLQSVFYLGDSLDMTVAVDNIKLRVIMPPEHYENLAVGDKVELEFSKSIVFEDKGDLDEQLRIQT